jgi:hypothetical protein
MAWKPLPIETLGLLDPALETDLEPGVEPDREPPILGLLDPGIDDKPMTEPRREVGYAESLRF